MTFGGTYTASSPSISSLAGSHDIRYAPTYFIAHRMVIFCTHLPGFEMTEYALEAGAGARSPDTGLRVRRRAFK